MWRNTPLGYGLLSKLFHWIIAALIFGLIALGWWMVGLDYYHPQYHSSLSLHKSLGMIVLLAVLLKAVWRFVSPYPQLSANLSALQQKAALSVHVLLWLAMIFIPLTGYAISTSEGAGVSVFNWIEVPAWLPRSETLRDIVTKVHAWIAYGGGALAIAHALAALKHQFIDGDGTLRRML
ncbi:MAG: cytochrome b [Gammaproteobacteria bacterium]